MDPTPTKFLVTRVFDLEGRIGLLASGKTLEGKVREGMVLRDESNRRVRILALEFLSPRDMATGEVTILLERTDPSPVQPDTVLMAVDPAS